jgi:hypothetical protein
MSRSGQKAIDWLLAHNYQSREGMCLLRVHEVFATPARYGDAATAFHHTTQRHGGTPPIGVPVWWTGGTHGYGHIAASDGKGWCYSTDIKRPGRFDRVPIATIGRAWPLEHYQGWSEDINGFDIWNAPRPMVDLSDMAWCARHEPGTIHHRFPSQTQQVARALHAEGHLPAVNINGHWGGAKVRAYAAFQRDLRKTHPSVPTAGIPDLISLTWLTKHHGLDINL